MSFLRILSESGSAGKLGENGFGIGNRGGECASRMGPFHFRPGDQELCAVLLNRCGG